jgi:hypothetical protein
MRTQIIMAGVFGLFIWVILLLAMCIQTTCSSNYLNYLTSALAFTSVTTSIYIAYRFRLQILTFVLKTPVVILAPVIFFLAALASSKIGSLSELGPYWLYVAAMTLTSCLALSIFRAIGRNIASLLLYAFVITLLCLFFGFLGGIGFIWVSYIMIVNVAVSLALWFCIAFIREQVISA